MKLGELKSLGHNVADSLASGVGLLIGVYYTSVFAEASAEPNGYVVVDFLAGTAFGEGVSASLQRAVSMYKDALPKLCAKHRIQLSELAKLEARYGNDAVYGPHFTVTVENRDGRHSTDRYLGFPGKRIKRLQPVNFPR